MKDMRMRRMTTLARIFKKDSDFTNICGNSNKIEIIRAKDFQI